ncbi:MAG: AAA family ATPase [Calothrix sp. SM1_7_51]|nr:AAA family ATPase [Calothrix sp. SM1_7_51]
MNKLVTIAARQWKSLLAFNLLVVLGTLAAFATSKPVWTSSTQLILPKTTSNLDASLGTLGSLQNGGSGFSSEVNPLKVQASILTSDTLLEQVLAIDPEKDKLANLSRYKSLFSVSPQEQSTIISLTVSGSSPEIAKTRATNLIQVYQRRLNELRQTNSQTKRQFSQKELEQAKKRLTQAQSAIAKFKQSTGLVDNQEQTRALVTTMNTLATSRAQALASAQASGNRARVIATRLNLEPNQAVRSLSLGENKEYQFLRNKLAEIEANLVKKQAIFTNVHPDIVSLQIERQQLQNQIREYVVQAAGGANIDPNVATDSQGRAPLIQELVLAESEAVGQIQQAQQLERQIVQIQGTLNSLPANQAKLSELQRQVDVTEGVYKGLVAQIQQNNIDAFDAYPNVQLLDAPKVNPSPVSPKLFLMAINAILASAIGSIALVLFLESRNPLLSPKDLQEQKFPIVERIPRIKQLTVESELTSELTIESEVEFQRLASAISLQPLENRRLLITSASVGEGKTTVTIGLAYALVDLGFKVLLVDGDFRQAQLSRRLGYAENTVSEKLCVSIQHNLDLLPTLPKQGKIVEMIRKGGFEQTLSTCESTGDYDYVIIDSAPVSLTSETSLMATIIHNVLFVIRPDTSYKNLVSESFAQLTQHNAQFLGLVVNAVENQLQTIYLHLQNLILAINRFYDLDFRF